MSDDFDATYAELIGELLVLSTYDSFEDVPEALRDSYYYAAAIAGELDEAYDPESRHEARLQALVWNDEYDCAIRVARYRQPKSLDEYHSI